MGFLRRLMDSERARQVTWLVLVLMIVGSMIQTYTATRCQADFNVVFAAASRERNVIADRWRDEQIAYLKVVRVEKNPAVRLQALDEYLSSLEFAADRREATPLPTNPRCD